MERLVDAIDKFKPQIYVVLFDITSSKDVAVVTQLAEQYQTIPIVALAVPHVATDVIACADAGFTSYVPRDSSYPELIKIIGMALRGETPCDPKISRSLLEEVARRKEPTSDCRPDNPLTRRQAEILSYVARGLSNKEIASELNLSIATVKNHVHLVLKKLCLKSRSEAAVLASREPSLLPPLNNGDTLNSALRSTLSPRSVGEKMPMGTT